MGPVEEVLDRYVKRITECIPEQRDDCKRCVEQIARIFACELTEVVLEAYTDVVTGLPVRRLFEKMKEREVELARRKSLPLSIIFIDLDNLKMVNDLCGHRTGDRYLKSIADILRTFVRRSDMVFRYGGDEFLILAHTEVCGAEKLVKRILSEIEGLPNFCDRGGTAVRPSVSVGIAEVDVFAGVKGLEEAIELADKRMYADKKRKREGNFTDEERA